VGEKQKPGTAYYRAMRRVVRRLHYHVTARAQALSIVAAGLLIAIAGVMAFSRYAVAPATGVIVAVKNSYGVTASFDMRPRIVAGNYARFACPRGLTAMPAQTTGSTVTAYNWKHQDIQTWRLAISIIDVPSYKLTDNNAYLFRKLHPQRFRESLRLVNGQMVPIMTDLDAEGFSKVGFLKHGRYQAVVSLYGDDQQGQDQLRDTLAMVLSSWQWL